MIFYDFEVFSQDWLVVFKMPISNQTTIIHNDRNQLLEFYQNYQKELFIGFNNRGYDQYIFKGILLELNPYEISKYIIEGNKGWQFSNLFNRIIMNNFDAMTTRNGLKELEGFMGHEIKESSVSFDIDRPLNNEELEEIIKYCERDVSETIEIFKLRIKEFESHLTLLKTFKLSLSNMSKTKAQLSAKILEANKKVHNDEFELNLPKNLLLGKYARVKDWFYDKINQNKELETELEELEGSEIYKQKLKIEIANVPHILGWGGIHGAKVNYATNGIIVNMDVSSYYPSLIINYDYLSRNAKPNKYKDFFDMQVKYKKENDFRSEPLKIVLNATFGLSKYKYSALYDPLQANNICVAGQLLLLDLIEKLENKWELLQSNTDGLIGKVQNMRDYNKLQIACAKWEERTKMKLKFDIYERIYQKDVNNYIIIDKSEKYKSKGSYLKTRHSLDNDLPIVNKALINFLLSNIPIEKTINECNELIMFQKVTKVSNKYSHIIYGNEIIHEKCIRTFASTKHEKGVWKLKIGKTTSDKIENTPKNCFIDNSNIIDKTIPEYLDKQWYIDLTNKRVKEFGK